MRIPAWKWLPFGMFLFSLTCLRAQPFLKRYVPGNYLVDNNHRVELFNSTNQPLVLDGVLLVTRDYSFRFPAGVRIPPRGTFVIAKQPASGVNYALIGKPDFLVRFHYLEHAGHYVALFSPAGVFLEGLYLSPSQYVPFLPDRDTLIGLTGDRFPFYLPPENRPGWYHAPMLAERSLGYVRRDGNWSPDSKVSMGVSVRFVNERLDYRDGVATVAWSFEGANGFDRIWIERSTDLKNYQVMREEEGVQAKKGYLFQESGLKVGQVYFYRLRARDAKGQEYYSEAGRLMAMELKQDFSMDLQVASDGELSIRIDSRFAQEVRLKLFNERLQEKAILFQDYVYANSPALIVVAADLIPGQKYGVMATTDHGRFMKEFVAPRK